MYRRLASLLVALTLVSPAAWAAEDASSFLTQAAAVNRFQIAAGQHALRKTQADIVRSFANQMIVDYSAAGMKLRQAAADVKLPLREGLDARHKAVLDELMRVAPGKTLSKAYFDAQEQVLRDDLATFERYAKGGDNERLRFFAGEMVPVVRGHLEQLARVRK